MSVRAGLGTRTGKDMAAGGAGAGGIRHATRGAAPLRPHTNRSPSGVQPLRRAPPCVVPPKRRRRVRPPPAVCVPPRVLAAAVAVVPHRGGASGRPPHGEG